MSICDTNPPYQKTSVSQVLPACPLSKAKGGGPDITIPRKIFPQQWQIKCQVELCILFEHDDLAYEKIRYREERIDAAICL